MEGYSAVQVSELTGADYHNILYWLRSGLVQAGHTPNRKPKPRHPIRFSFPDLVEIGIIQELRERGTPVQRIQLAINHLKNLGPDYTFIFDPAAVRTTVQHHKTIYLDVSGNDIQVYDSDQALSSAMRYQGQKVIHFLIINVSRLREELDVKLKRLNGQGGSQKSVHAAAL